MSDAFWTTAGLVLLSLIALANMVVMFWMSSIKERRQDERQRVADERADERAILQVQASEKGAEKVAEKVAEVKVVAEKTATHAETVAKNTSVETVVAIEKQTVELKEAIKSNGNGGSKEKS